MKIFITGHTSGIGQALFDLLTPDYTVMGGSRRIGWDVGETSNYDQVLDYDVLVNNAYHRTGQLELLRYVYSHWKNTPKTIINVGSAHIHHQIGRPLTRLDYNVSKSALEHYSNWICNNDTVCRSMMYNPGFVDTPLARSAHTDWPKADQDRVMSKSISAEECAKTIKFMIENSTRFREVTQM